MQSDVIDLVLIGGINKKYLLETIRKAERATNKKIKYLTYTAKEAKGKEFDHQYYLLIYEKSYSILT